jgi:hypothetical protein
LRPQRQLSSTSNASVNSQYQSAKEKCVLLLLSLGATYAEAAFRLSDRFDFFPGIMMAALESDTSKSLLPQLYRLINDSDKRKSNDAFVPNTSFAKYCLEWLEQRNLPVDILEMGRYAPDHLRDFLKVCNVVVSV